MNDPPPPAKFEIYNKEIYKQLFLWLYVLPIVVGEDIYILPSTYDFLIQ